MADELPVIVLPLPVDQPATNAVEYPNAFLTQLVVNFSTDGEKPSPASIVLRAWDAGKGIFAPITLPGSRMRVELGDLREMATWSPVIAQTMGQVLVTIGLILAEEAAQAAYIANPSADNLAVLQAAQAALGVTG